MMVEEYKNRITSKKEKTDIFKDFTKKKFKETDVLQSIELDKKVGKISNKLRDIQYNQSSISHNLINFIEEMQNIID